MCIIEWIAESPRQRKPCDRKWDKPDISQNDNNEEWLQL